MNDGADSVELSILAQIVYNITHLVFMLCHYGCKTVNNDDGDLLSSRYGPILLNAAER